MSEIILVTPEGALPLRLTLGLVEDLEKTGGSLFKTADMLLQKELPLGDIVRLVKAAYRHAGCKTEDTALDEFILQHSPALVLTEILTGLLTPMQEMGAGETLPAG